MHLKRKNNFVDCATHMNRYCHVLKFECIKEQLLGNTEKSTELLSEHEGMIFLYLCVCE